MYGIFNDPFLAHFERNICRKKDMYSFIQQYLDGYQNRESFLVGIPRFWDKSHFGGLVNLNIDTQGDFLNKEWDGL